MKKILVMNNVSDKGLNLFPRDRFEISASIDSPDAILLRSQNLLDYDFPPTVKVVGRAGAGVNNIPVARLTELGVPVLNTPGANANAVKELVLTGMLLASRNICQAWSYVKELKGADDTISQLVEKGKKQFVGFELPGRTLGVVGLGSIGVKVANAAIALGMRVVGYDPQITIKKAWELSSQVEEARSIDELLPQVDFLTLHVPLTDQTKNFMNAPRLQLMKKGSVLLNFSREGVVNEEDLIKALEHNLHAYVCDFPTKELIPNPKVIALPHLGASTFEAEENCAVMVSNQVRQFLEDGNIENSVNFPEVFMGRSGEGVRIAVANRNVPNMVAQISSVLAKQNLNIIDLINKSKANIAYTLIDINEAPSNATRQALLQIDGVINARICD